MEKDFVLSPLTDVERFSALINMKQWQCGIFQICDAKGDPVCDPLLYALFFNQITTVYNWFMTGEHNENKIFHVHALLRTGQRTDALRRTMTATWESLNLSENYQMMIGQQATIDCLKLQKCHKPSSLTAYMMKGPEWVVASEERMLQLAYDIEKWNLNDRFKPKENEPETAPEMNQMTRDLIELIVTNGCKTIEDCMRHGPQILSKYLHKPGLSAIVQNCITFVKSSGATWNLGMYEIYEPNPEAIHKVLLHQGIRPQTFDLVMFTWLTKLSSKQNTLVLWGPSNTGKSGFIAGFKSIIPWGEITNGSSGFNFEGLIDQVIGIWEEPLINPETAEKCKQIFEGMTCSIPVKYKKPYMLSRIPILMTTNHAPWRFCTAEEQMFKNRMYIFEWNYECKDQPFHCRTSEPRCQCRYCERSRCSEITASTTGLSQLQGEEQPVVTGEQSPRAEQSSNVGSGSMSAGDGGDQGCHGSSGSSSFSSQDINSPSTSGNVSGGSSRTERHMGKFRIIRRGNLECGATGTTPVFLESERIRGNDGGNSSRDGAGGSGGGGNGSIRGNGRKRAEKRTSSVTLGSWLASGKIGEPVPTQTKKQKVDSFLATLDRQETNETMSVPTAAQWRQYLSYLFHWHG